MIIAAFGAFARPAAVPRHPAGQSQPPLQIGRTPRSLRAFVRPPLNGSIVERTSMTSKRALEEFETYLRRAGDGKAPRTPRAGVESMTAFYRDIRATDVDTDFDGDMLLFQWGTFDRGDGDMFELDITRQLSRSGGEDEDIWQLHLTYRFVSNEALRAIGNGDHWCERPDDLAALESFLMAHPAIVAIGSRTDGQAQIEYECAG